MFVSIGKSNVSKHNGINLGDDVCLKWFIMLCVLY